MELRPLGVRTPCLALIPWAPVCSGPVRRVTPSLRTASPPHRIPLLIVTPWNCWGAAPGTGPRPVRRSRHEPELSVRAPEGRLFPGPGGGRRAAQREPGLPAHRLGDGGRRLPAASAASIRLLPLPVSAGAVGGRAGAVCAAGGCALAGMYELERRASEHACVPPRALRAWAGTPGSWERSGGCLRV